MLLRSLFLLLFSSQVFSAANAIDVDLGATINPIKYYDEGEWSHLYAELSAIGDCSESLLVTPNDTSLNTFLNISGFTLSTEKFYFDGSKLNNFTFHQDGTWTVYDDINRKLLLNWDEDCPAALSAIDFSTNYENINTVGVAKEIDMAYFNSDTDGGIFNLGDEDNLSWLDNKPDGAIDNLFLVDNTLFAKISGGENTGIWQVKPQWQKKMGAPLNSDNSIVKTYGGLIGVSKSTSLSLKWLDKTEKSTFLFHAASVNDYSVYPFSTGALLVADSSKSWKFQLIQHGEKEKIISFPRPVNEILSCHKTNYLFFCLDKRDSGQILIWRLTIPVFGEPVFEMDAKIPAGILADGMIVKAVQVSNTHRLLTVLNGNEYGLISVSATESNYNALGQDGVFKKITLTENGYVALDSQNASLMIQRIQEKPLSIYLTSLISQSEEIKVIDGVEKEKEIKVEPVEEPLEEREENEDDPDAPRERAELNGAISLYYLFAVMLLLITGRRKV
ncbi:MAG: hypothetical protein ACI8SR_003040 [Oceanicoccus sp.]|jgi:hypothetical protein